MKNNRKPLWQRTGLKLLLPLLLALIGFLTIRCDYTISGNPDVSLVRVSVSPQTVRLLPKGTVDLKATVSNYLHDGSISWFILSEQMGSLSVSGDSAFYTAPDSILIDPATVIIRVRSFEDTSAYADCKITITTTDTIGGAAFYVEPLAVTIKSGASERFRLQSAQGNLPAVQWSVTNGVGTVSPSGVYTAPATLSGGAFALLRATSVLDTSKYATARVILRNAVDTSICFSRDVQPILVNSCGMRACHGGVLLAANLNLTTYDGIVRALKPGDARSSRIYITMTTFNENLRMPPPPYPPVTPWEIRTVGRWIDDGAVNSTCK